MRRYYEILERCEYLSMNADTTGHGLRGWLGVNKADARLGLADFKILQIVKAAAITAGHGLLGDIGQLLGLMNRDLNAPGAARDAKEGLYQMPLAVNGDGRRNGPREFLLDTVRRGFPLTIKTGIFVTRVLFSERPDAQGKYKATGVEYMEGKHLYRADPNPSDANPVRQKLTVKREVILAAGAFNTPQILKLSGVGPREELTALRIPVKVDLPGVGTNLQDRYEVGVISEVKDNFALVNKCTFGASTGDPCLDKWRTADGPYTTNGIAACIVKRSSTADQDPDLFVFGGPAFFKGYYPGYSRDATRDKKHFTWAVLKAHTHNTAGTVTLKTSDPRDVPEINFKYFDEGTREGNASQRDVDAVVDGILVAREIGKHTADLMLVGVPLIGGRYEEQVPGPTYKTREQLREFVKNESWGHHASCTCKMGKADDPTAVLDSRFRVRGTTGLRVVDASVFPKIPGVFIVVPIYMMSERATDVLLEDIGERRRVG